MSLVVKAQVMNLVNTATKGDKYSVSSDFVSTLDKEVNDLILNAIERAKANKRKTVMSRDL